MIPMPQHPEATILLTQSQKDRFTNAELIAMAVQITNSLFGYSGFPGGSKPEVEATEFTTKLTHIYGQLKYLNEQVPPSKPIEIKQIGIPISHWPSPAIPALPESASIVPEKPKRKKRKSNEASSNDEPKSEL